MREYELSQASNIFDEIERLEITFAELVRPRNYLARLADEANARLQQADNAVAKNGTRLAEIKRKVGFLEPESLFPNELLQ